MASLFENEICKFWELNNIFQKTIKGDKEYNFFQGPPFATNRPHYGHVSNLCIKHVVLTYQAQLGCKIPRKMSFDSHGLPIEIEIEKIHLINTQQIGKTISIKDYNQKCKDIVMNCASDWKNILTRAGTWFDFDNNFKTMDFDYMNSVWWSLKEMHNKKLLYRSYKVLPYSVACKTALSNFELQMNYQSINDETLYVKFKLENNKNLLIWTTTPWTLPSNMAIAINKNINYCVVEYDNEEYIIAEKLVEEVFKRKKDNKYKIIETILGEELLDFKYIPLFNCMNSEYKIIHGDFVKDTDGTGLVHIAPSYGEEDYYVSIKNNIISKKDKLFMSIDENGIFVKLKDLDELEGVYYKNYPKNKDILDGNTIIIKKLKSNNMIFLSYNYEHSYPFCWRTDKPLMYRAIENWFINVESQKDRMIEINQNINWVPSNIGSRFKNWLKDARDWCIARERYWGTPIPVWINENDEDDYIVISSSYELEKMCNLEPNSIKDLHRENIDHLIIELEGKRYKRITPILDCWFESGCLPFAQHGFPYKTLEINPTSDFISEGIDQCRGWFYTLLVISTALFDVEPFKNVVVTGLILASDGKKMSKRLKNYTDITEIIELYGADPLRLYLLNSPMTKGQTVKFNDADVKEMNNVVIIHLVNVLKFYLEYKKMFKTKYQDKELYNESNYTSDNSLDLYIINQTKNIMKDIRMNIGSFQLSEAVKNLVSYVDILSNQYIKFNRASIKGKNEGWLSSLSTFYLILNYMSVQLAPLIPFTSEYIYQKLNNTEESVHLVDINSISLPELTETQIELAKDTNNLMYIIRLIFTLKSKNNINLFTFCNKLIIKSSQKIIDMINKNMDFLIEESKVLKTSVEPFNDSDINIILTPNFNIIREKYPNDIKIIKDLIKDLINNELKLKLYNGETIIINGYELTKEFVNIIIEPIKLPDFISEYSYYNDENYCIYLNTDETDEIKDLNFASMIAKHFQLMRKNHGLHPWDPIILGLSCNLNNYISNTIKKVCDHYPIYFDDNSDNFTIIKKEKFNDIYLFLLK